MATLVKLSEISRGTARQRTSLDMTKLQELSASIQANELFHPVVVEELEAGYELIAGGRRCAAIELIYDMGGTFSYQDEVVPVGCVPVTLRKNLTLTQRAEIELEENISREDLSWQDRVAAVARVAELKKQIAIEASLPIPSQEEIATSLERERTWMGDEIRIAEKLSDPDIAGAKSVTDALKVLRKKTIAEQRQKMAEQVGTSFSAEKSQLHNVECISWMREATPNQFDVIVADPPYGMGADSFGDSGGYTNETHNYQDTPELLTKLINADLFHLLFKVAKKDAHMYVFCDIDWFPVLKEAAETGGWRVHRTPIIWHKPSYYRTPWPEHGPQRKWEMCLYAIKGDKRTTGVYPDLVTIPPDEHLGHAAQKPVALYADLLKRSVYPGEAVLDPFVGSGPIFPAAAQLSCYVIGLEKDADSYAIALKRLQEI